MLQPAVPLSLLVERTELSNGLVVVSERIPNLHSVSLGLWLRFGSRHESREQSGMFHFVEHMLFKGTESRDARAIARIIDSIGGEMNAFTGKENTCFHARVLDEHLQVAVDLLADLVLHPTFRPVDVERERKVILEEIRMVDDTPDDLVQELLLRTCWKGNSLARPILGTRRTVMAAQPAALQQFFRERLTPDQLVLAAAGNLEHESFVDLASAALGPLAGSTPTPRLATPAFRPGVRAKVKRSLKQAHLCLGAPAFPRSHPERYALSVLNTILGSGMSSRLFQRVREEKSLAYDVFSEVVSYRDTGYVSVYLGTAPESVREALDTVLEELRRLTREPVSPEELSRAKEHLKGNLMLGLESTFDRMSNLATQEIYLGRTETLDAILAAIERVSVEDVLRVSLELFDRKPLALALLGKLDEALPVDPASVCC